MGQVMPALVSSSPSSTSSSSQTSLIEWSSSVSKVTTMTKVLVQRKPKASQEFEAKTTHVAAEVWGVLWPKTYLFGLNLFKTFLNQLKEPAGA